MKFFMGKRVMIFNKYSQYHRYIGNIVEADYEKNQFKVRFTIERWQQKNMISREIIESWIEYRHLRNYGTAYRTFKMDEMTKAIYAGMSKEIRKLIKKTPDKKRIYLSHDFINYFDTFEKGFFLIRKIEIVCDEGLSDVDYRLEVIE